MSETGAEHPKPLTRGRLLSIIEYQLEQAVHRKLSPEMIESIKEREKILRGILENDEPVLRQLSAHLARALMSLRSLTGQKHEDMKSFIEYIQSTIRFVQSEMSLPTDAEDGYKKWLDAKNKKL